MLNKDRKKRGQDQGQGQDQDQDHEQGQISIMVAVMMTTFLLFFVFVINTGMLVNAKINLQSAADLAAYAGAATQARQLNNIAHLNYEMRRQYKKFLFRYYVIGGMNQKSLFGSTTPNREFYPDDKDKKDFLVPVVCIIFNEKDNFCQVNVLPGIQIPPHAILDKINETLRDQLINLEKFRQRNCQMIAVSNRIILTQWLFNTDPNYETVASSLSGAGVPDTPQILDIIQGIASGIGVIPREMLLKRRIGTLAAYLNFPAQHQVKLGSANAMISSTDTAARERTIQAFFSAYRTLGNHTFPADDIVMDELLPKEIVKLEPIQIGFDVYYLDFVITGPNAESSPCEPNAKPITIRQKLTIGFKKDPTALTYYAIKLQAKARLLFSPFGELTLKAYAAAQPFGSRIGPTGKKFGIDDFVVPGKALGVSNIGGFRLQEKIPNLPIQKEDAVAKGWKQNKVIRDMFMQLKESGGATEKEGQQIIVLSSTSLERAYHAAMVANPWESGKFNIINDLTNDPLIKHFDNPQKEHGFWAPLSSADPTVDPEGGEPAAMITAMINDTLDPPPGSPAVFDDKFKEALKQGLLKYFEKLRSANGENGEGYNTVYLPDPFHRRVAAGGPEEDIDLPPELYMKDPKLVKTGWNDVKDGEFVRLGRSGYSVKFVSFKTLRERPVTSDGEQTWDNLIPFDGDQTAIDVTTLEH